MIRTIANNFALSVPQHIKGAFFKVVSSLSFALVNGLVRFLSGGVKEVAVDPLPFYEIAFLQNLFSTLFLMPGFIKGDKKFSFNAHKYPWLYFGYVAFAAMGLIFWYGSLHFLPLAICVSLGFLGPIFTIIGCRIFLYEKLSALRVSAILVSILRAFFITEPHKFFLESQTTNIYSFALFLPMLSSIFWVFSKLCSRKLLQKGETATNTTAFLLLFMTPISFFPAMGGFFLPSLTQLFFIILISILSTLAHLTLAKSFALAEVSFLTPFGFVRLLASGLIGYVAFGETPKGMHIWAGMAIILLSLFLLSKEKIYK